MVDNERAYENTMQIQCPHGHAQICTKIQYAHEHAHIYFKIKYAHKNITGFMVHNERAYEHTKSGILISTLVYVRKSSMLMSTVVYI
jgi:hypothetical protein